MATETALMTADQQAALIEQVVLQGDLSKLAPAQRVQYYRAVCQSLGLNPLTKPFDYITLNGKLTLYATRTATDQLRALKGISVTITDRQLIDDVYIVSARGTTPDGRTDEATGAVHVAGLKGENKANALMKAETKAKRRLTLSLAGLGWLDESEVGSVADARPARVDLETGEILDKPTPLPKPKAQHPLEAAGLSRAGVQRIARWIGQGKAPKEWSADQRAASQEVGDITRQALQAGIAAEEIEEILAAYEGRGAGIADAGAYLAQMRQMIADITALKEEDDGAPADDHDIPF